jgi:hypothetical protein
MTSAVLLHVDVSGLWAYAHSRVGGRPGRANNLWVSGVKSLASRNMRLKLFECMIYNHHEGKQWPLVLVLIPTPVSDLRKMNKLCISSCLKISLISALKQTFEAQSPNKNLLFITQSMISFLEVAERARMVQIAGTTTNHSWLVVTSSCIQYLWFSITVLGAEIPGSMNHQLLHWHALVILNLSFLGNCGSGQRDVVMMEAWHTYWHIHNVKEWQSNQ